MSIRKSTRTVLEEHLESDDDLPDTYEEVPDLPAYQNDQRFDILQFPSLKEKEWPALRKNKQNVSSSSTKENRADHDTKNILFLKSENKSQELEQTKKNLNLERKILVKRGVLSKQDLQCLKALVSTSTDVNVMWFVNFLMRKDMHDKYKFLKSCLIDDLTNSTPISKKNSKTEIKKFKYELNLL